MDIADGLGKGEFSFPFKFTLPKGIPGSFSFEMGRSKAIIRYDIYCEVGQNEVHGRARFPIILMQKGRPEEKY